MFTASDLKLFNEKGINMNSIMNQIENFKRGFPFINLTAAATPGNGIKSLNDEQVNELNASFNNKKNQYTVSKMVPASGAASRMFKSLHAFMDDIDKEADKDILEFINRIEDFAFTEELEKVIADNGHSLQSLVTQKKYRTIIRYLLTNTGLNYASLPKGLLYFHKYQEGPRMPLEEHIAEGIEYSRDIDGTVHLHFTVSPEHLELFREKADIAVERIRESADYQFNITYSIQKPSTDTIAVDLENNPFRKQDGSLFFRPGGHGALIENLNELEADIVFIKNIDNVVPDKLKKDTYTYKKVLGGLLIELMEKTYKYLDALSGREPDEIFIKEVADFALKDLNIQLPLSFHELPVDERSQVLKNVLNRPMRICGMVKNEGEPGGGPFWVRNEEGLSSLQIVESSQVNIKDKKQVEILGKATHFNPVDLVCSMKDFTGRKFDLRQFVDPKTGFISLKSKDGKDLKAQELPGLWNGAMAKWITIFVEVPIETFNPVKTVNDLLRPQHQ